MFLFLLIAGALFISILLFLRTSRFGALSSGAGLSAIHQSPNYRNGQFHNLSVTPDLAEGVTYPAVIRDFLFKKSKRTVPAAPVPAIKTDLHNLNPADNLLVWFGHSSYFIQVDGKRILVDPVFSGAASPVSFTTKSFAGSDSYKATDIPDIDYLFISHDHWDHMDYKTLLGLKPRIGKIITGLGTGAHLRRWGFSPEIIIEKDWNTEVTLEDGFKVFTTPGRHFSGRGLKRNQALWMSFVLSTPEHKLFLGGDSGYDTHFKEIGKSHGPFDLAILECGQYNASWRYIHMLPDEVAQAAEDLRAARLLPVHWAKFTLSLHAWDEPILKIMAAAAAKSIPVAHPMIGEIVWLDQSQAFKEWWADRA